MAKTGPVEFLREVRSEVAKVTWPTRRETLITAAMVLTMVIAAALTFFVIDLVWSRLVSFILELGR